MAHSSKKSGVDGVQVTKRDGRTEDFDSSKITLAIEKCFKNGLGDRKSTRLNSSHSQQSRMPSSA